MTKGEVPVRDMGRLGKELGRLEAVLEKQAKVEEKSAEIQDLEEVRFSSCCSYGGACFPPPDETDKRVEGRGPAMASCARLLGRFHLTSCVAILLYLWLSPLFAADPSPSSPPSRLPHIAAWR